MELRLQAVLQAVLEDDPFGEADAVIDGQRMTRLPDIGAIDAGAIGAAQVANEHRLLVDYDDLRMLPRHAAVGDGDAGLVGSAHHMHAGGERNDSAGFIARQYGQAWVASALRKLSAQVCGCAIRNGLRLFWHSVIPAMDRDYMV